MIRLHPRRLAPAAQRLALAALTAACLATPALAQRAGTLPVQGADSTASASASAAARAAADGDRWARCNAMNRTAMMAAQIGDWSAMETFSRQQIAECDWNADLRADGLENLADSRLMRGELAAALQGVDECLALQPNRTGCQVTRAMVLAHLNRLDEAGTAMRAAREALAHEARDYAGRRAGLRAAPVAAGDATAARAAEMESVETYVAKLVHLDKVIAEMERALPGAR